MATLTHEEIRREMIARIEAAAGVSRTGKPAGAAAEEPAPKEDPYFKEDTTPGFRDTGSGLKKLSDVLDIRLSKNQDVPVRVFEDEDWPEEIRMHIPTPNMEYVFQKDAISDLATAVLLNDNVWMSGKTGVGKSSMAKEFCARVRRPFIRVNGRGDLESGAIFGQYVVEDGTTKWKDGAFTEAYKYGAIFLQDEPTVIPAEISMGYQWVLEDKGCLFLADKAGSNHERTVLPHPEFRFFCADNTKGLGDDRGSHAGTTVWNTATLDRFGTSITMDYLKPSVEVTILTKKFPELTEKLATNMVKLAGLVRTGYDEGHMSLTMSPRTLISWAQKSLFYQDYTRALRVAFYEKLGSEAEQKALSGFFHQVFNERL